MQPSKQTTSLYRLPTTSADDGTFTFASLQAGSNYTLTVTKTGYVKMSFIILQYPLETTADQDVLLTTTITLSGTVLARADGERSMEPLFVCLI